MERSSKPQAQAQAQAVRREAITSAQSQALVQALLRVSLYHVSYLRGIFPEEHYKPVEMRNLDNMEIRMLMPKDPESERLVQWVEGGVVHALERRYLRKVFFGFSRDAAGKDLLEEYVFSFSYDEDGGVHMAAGGSSRAGRKGFSTRDEAAKGPTLNSVKYQVCRLMRMLVELTNTLEQVPDERFLFMKLTYTDDTPEEYEPPMFAPAADGGVGCFSRMPFVMEVGRVDTRHIKVGLAVKTVLDNVEEGGEWEDGPHLPVADDNSNLFCATEQPEPTAATGNDAICGAGKRGGTSGPAASDSADESMGGGYSCAAAPGRKVPAGEVAQRPDSASQQSRQPAVQPPTEELAAVHTWIMGRPHGEVHVVDALARFAAVDCAVLEACFAALQREGLLVPTSQPDCYNVVKAAAATAAAPPSPSAQQALRAAEEAMAGLQVAPLDSRAGGVHDVPGSQRTMSVAGKRKQAAEEEGQGSQGSDAAPAVFPETQPSANGGGRGGRKASMVREPIAQSAKRRRKGAAPARAAAAAEEQQQPAAGVRRSTRRR